MMGCVMCMLYNCNLALYDIVNTPLPFTLTGDVTPHC